MRKLRGSLLDNLADAADELGASLDGDVRKAIAAIKRGKHTDVVIRRETRKLTTRHTGRLAKTLAGQVKHAASLAKRYAEIMNAMAAQGRKGEPLTAFATETAIRTGKHRARQALAPEVLLNQKGRTPTRFVGDHILKDNVNPWRQVRVLSKELHGRALRAADDISTQVIAATREAKSLTESATSLIRVVRATGKGELGQGAELSQLMKDVEKAGKALNQRGSAADLKEWQRLRRQMEKKVKRLAEGGRTQSSLIELLQRTKKDSAKGIDRAMRQQVAFKQKYNAERILQTETLAAYKADQVLSDQKHDFVVGYIWRMNRAARAGFVRRRTSKSGRIIGAKRYRRGGRRRRCVCEELNGKRLSKEAVAGRTARLMAHPHCMCFLEPVMSKKLLSVAQAGDFD